jgi:hypothetical protein
VFCYNLRFVEGFGVLVWFNVFATCYVFVSRPDRGQDLVFCVTSVVKMKKKRRRRRRRRNVVVSSGVLLLATSDRCDVTERSMAGNYASRVGHS